MMWHFGRGPTTIRLWVALVLAPITSTHGVSCEGFEN